MSVTCGLMGGSDKLGFCPVLLYCIYYRVCRGVEGERGDGGQGQRDGHPTG